MIIQEFDLSEMKTIGDLKYEITLIEYDEDDFRIKPSSSIYKQVKGMLYFHEIKTTDGKSMFRQRTFNLQTKESDNGETAWKDPIRTDEIVDGREISSKSTKIIGVVFSDDMVDDDNKHCLKCNGAVQEDLD